MEAKTTCPHAAGNVCAIASALAGEPIDMRTDPACAVCEKQSNARGTNSVTVSLAVSSLTKAGKKDQAAPLLQQYGYLLRVTSPPPSWTQQAFSVAGAVGRWLLSGMQRVDQATYQARLATCEGCPNRNVHRCQVCGCFCEVKTAMPLERCPLDPPLWAAVDVETTAVVSAAADVSAGS